MYVFVKKLRKDLPYNEDPCDCTRNSVEKKKVVYFSLRDDLNVLLGELKGP